MAARMMILPADTAEATKLVRIPEDMEPQEAYRHVTAIIATVEQQGGASDWDDIAEMLEARNFVPEAFILGPSLGKEG